MNRFLLRSVLPASALLMLAGCTDDKYDLDNMDKTVGVSINDLVVPVNLDAITLNNVFDLDENGSIVKEEYQGQQVFVFKKSGDFHSDDIHVSSFHVNAPADQEPTTTEAHLEDRPPVEIADLSYNITPTEKPVSYHVNDVDRKIKTIQSIESKYIRITLRLDMDADAYYKASSIKLKDIKIQFPTGLRSYTDASESAFTDAKAYIIKNNQKIAGIAKYDASTGYVTIPEYICTAPQTFLQIEANSIDLKAAPVNGAFNYDTSIDVEAGKLVFSTSNASKFPSNFDFVVYYNLSGFDISRFSGNIDYDIEGLNFDPVDLNDMPDVFAGDETRVRIANPQLYIQVDNTCGQYGLGGNVGLKLTSAHANGSVAYDMPENIVIPPTPYVTDFAISPEGEDLNPIDPYKQAAYIDKIRFTDLSNVLYGSESTGYGIPSTIDVDFVKPQINGDAKRFPLRSSESDKNNEVPAVTGKYLFYAPLALDDGSVIVYTGDDKGWDDDTLDGLKVKTFTVNAKASSDLPVGVSLKAYALDKEGNRMGVCDGISLDPYCDGKDIMLTITPTEAEGVISGIDGIYYEATCVQDRSYDSPAAVPALSPDMNIKLENLRIKVSGSFEKDLDD